MVARNVGSVTLCNQVQNGHSMITTKNYTQKELAYYFASQATASVVYLEGGYILRIGLDSKTPEEPYNHNYCRCGGIPGEVSEIAIKLIGGLAVAKFRKEDFNFSRIMRIFSKQKRLREN
jgi:hypothetical protein